MSSRLFGGILKRNLSNCVRALFGPRHTWSYASTATRLSRDFDARLDDAFARVHDEVKACDDQPVFIFSAGWRSGSTLLQRMLMQHNEKIVMWGEPYHLSNIFDGLANQFRAFTSGWPKASHFLSTLGRDGLADQWVANLYPDVDDLVIAHREFLNSLFARPAYRAGASCWGMKVVRLSIEHATYLHKLFPKCKTIFLCRDPVHSYASFRTVYDAWFARWPDKVVATPYAFGKHWARLTEGYLAGYRGIGGVFIRYEDLDSSEHVSGLSQYLGWPVSCASELQRIVGGIGGVAGDKKPKLPYSDRKILAMVTGRVRRMAGYRD